MRISDWSSYVCSSDLSFKPFVYLAALDSGYAPTTQILDAPFVIDQGAGLGKWKPSNYTHKFYGPTPMRIGVEQSRTLMTVRLAQTIGLEKVVDYAARFGVVAGVQPHLRSEERRGGQRGVRT